MSFWRRERRCDKRYRVSWEAALEVSFRDCRDTLPVTVIDFSPTGARFLTRQVSACNRSLICLESPPELVLKSRMPEGAFHAVVHIRWYRWVVDQNAFEVAVEFGEMTGRSSGMIDRIMGRLRSRK